MIYEVAGAPIKFNFNPTRVESVLQNVVVILTTPKFSVPLDREFCMDASILDRPIDAAMMLLRAEIAQNIAEHEPRANIKTISFRQDDSDMLDGRLLPYVSFEVIDDGAA